MNTDKQKAEKTNKKKNQINHKVLLEYDNKNQEIPKQKSKFEHKNKNQYIFDSNSKILESFKKLRV